MYFNSNRDVLHLGFQATGSFVTAQIVVVSQFLFKGTNISRRSSENLTFIFQIFYQIRYWRISHPRLMRKNQIFCLEISTLKSDF